MLKKGQVDDTTLMVIAVILIIIGGVFFGLLSKAHSEQLNEEKTIFLERDEGIIDTELMTLDLLTILDLQITENYTFQELSTLFPENYPEIQDTFLTDQNLVSQGAFNKKLGCEQIIFDKFDEILYPTYDNFWYIEAYIENSAGVAEPIFYCTPHDYSQIYYTLVRIPSKDTENTIVITLGVTEWTKKQHGWHF